MALLGTLIDSRTLATMASNGSVSFAHGLPSIPDEVVLFANATTNSTTSWALAVTYDATNVTITAYGAGTCPSLRCLTKVHHSLIR